MVGRSLPNATATGRPTYPRPTRATVASLAGGMTSASLRSRTSGMRHLLVFRDDEIVGVPIDGFFQSFHDPNRGAEAEQPARLRDVGARELQIAAPRLTMHRLHALRLRLAARHAVADQP